jgi:hypothetical protein
MKFIKILLSGGALALASGALHAQTISGIGGIGSGFTTDGDLILGFDDSTSEPSAGDLVVDIGPASDYLSTSDGGSLTPGTAYTVAAYSSADLTTVYGSTEISNGDVGYTVFGGNGLDGGPGATATKTLWFSTPGASAINAKTGSLQSGTSSTIDDYTLSLSPPSSALASPEATQDTGYQSNTSVLNGTSFTSHNTEASTAGISGSGTVSLTLYELLPRSSGTGPGTDLGTFTLSSTALTFTPFAAIPEPSTYAAILGAVAIGFVVIRRRAGAAALSSIA